MSDHKTSYFNPEILGKALMDSFIKLNPILMIKNPVMFIVYIASVITTGITLVSIFTGGTIFFNLSITLWLWFTLLFANFSEAIAEGQGKARADSLIRNKKELTAKQIKGDIITNTPAADLKPGDHVICIEGDIIPCDGEIIDGIASIDESAITGESAPVIREAGGDRCSVIIGTRVISDRIVIRVATAAGDTYLDKMIRMIEGAKRQKTPNEISLTILLSSLTVLFLITVFSLFFFYRFTALYANLPEENIPVTVLISLLICLIPTTIGGLLSAIGISGMDRMLYKNIIAKSGKAIEACGDVDVILLDKTGTITYGNRMASDLIPAPGVDIKRLTEAALLSSLSDTTPEGKSILHYLVKNYGLTDSGFKDTEITFTPFSANTRSSQAEICLNGGKIRTVRKGSASAIREYILRNNGVYPDEVETVVESISRKGGTPLVVSDDLAVLGVIHLKDVIKKGIRDRFARLRKMGIKTILITGDNPLTAAAIALEAGVDDFISEATPEAKLKRIVEEQEKGHLVAMIGDGTNDAPALAQADVGVVMNAGTQTAKEAGNMIDLDSNPTKLIEVVETGKQLLMTRGALTTFSIANDVAKYFAIIPAIFSTLFIQSNGKGVLSIFNIMQLASPQSAILSAVIFNALIIIALIPLALKGVRYRPMGANRVLFRNLLIFGGGGLVTPFIGIKLIDLLINFLGVI